MNKFTQRQHIKSVWDQYENHYKYELDFITKKSQEWHILEMLKLIDMGQYVTNQSKDEMLADEIMKYIEHTIRHAEAEQISCNNRGNYGTAWHHKKVVEVFRRIAQKIEGDAWR